jgi:hypothetical protein
LLRGISLPILPCLFKKPFRLNIIKVGDHKAVPDKPQKNLAPYSDLLLYDKSIISILMTILARFLQSLLIMIAHPPERAYRYKKHILKNIQIISMLEGSMTHALLYRKGMFCFFMLFLLLLSGCLTTSPKKSDLTIFFPAPPELPRLQYLTSINGSADVLPKSSSFDNFVTGGRKSINLDKPYGIAVRDGKIYVCDTNSTIYVFDYKNQRFTSLQGAKGRGSLVQPINIRITPNGYKYVADSVRGQVLAYDDKDFFIKAYGTKQNWKPVDALPLDEYLYVADTKNRVVKVFDIQTGELSRTIGNTSEKEEGRLGMPLNLAFDKNKILHVVDAMKFNIAKYDRDGHYIESISGPGQSVGRLARPRGIAFDKENRIYIVDAAFNNVQIFHDSGQILLPFGFGGRMKGAFYLPAGIAIDYDMTEYFKEYIDPDFDVEFLVFVTNQFEKNSINIFGFGTKKGSVYPTYEEDIKAAKERDEEILSKEGEAEKKTGETAAE